MHLLTNTITREVQYTMPTTGGWKDIFASFYVCSHIVHFQIQTTLTPTLCEAAIKIKSCFLINDISVIQKVAHRLLISLLVVGLLYLSFALMMLFAFGTLLQPIPAELPTMVSEITLVCFLATTWRGLTVDGSSPVTANYSVLLPMRGQQCLTSPPAASVIMDKNPQICPAGATRPP